MKCIYKFYRNVYDYSKNWFNIVHTLSFNKSKIFILTNRNIGKTYGAKIWRILAGVKHGKQTLWLRVFSNEIKAVREDFINEPMIRSLGLDPADFKMYGKWLMYKKRRIIRFEKLSSATDMKGLDKPDLDTIIFDEFTIPPSKMSLYRGNMGKDLSSIYKSARRNKKHFHMVCFGNKETVDSPIFHQFTLTPLQEDFEGIAVKGDSLIEQINTIPECAKEAMEYDVDDIDIDYLQNGKTHGVNSTFIVGKLTDVRPLFGLNIAGYKLTVSACYDGTMYVRTGYNPNADYFTDFEDKGQFATRLTPSMRLIVANQIRPYIERNLVRYRDAESWEGFQYVAKMARIC